MYASFEPLGFGNVIAISQDTTNNPAVHILVVIIINKSISHLVIHFTLVFKPILRMIKMELKTFINFHTFQDLVNEIM